MDTASLEDPHPVDVDVVHALDPFGSLEDDDHTTDAMIAEATAAALASATSSTVDVVAVDAAALAAESAANLVDAAGVPVVSVHASSNDRKNEQRRKRYRERVLAEEYTYNEETGETIRRSQLRGTEGGTTSSNDDSTTGDRHSATRRARDRERYANMTQDERDAYNARRRKQYTQQSDAVRQRRRERERNRYHNLPDEKVKERNAKRARLERERYQKMSKEALEERNRKRRDRAAAARKKKMAEAAEAASITFEDSVTTCDFNANADPTLAGTAVEDPTTGILVDDRTAARGMTQQQQHRLHELFPPTQGTGAPEAPTGTIGETSLQDMWKDPTELS